ncbi:hypothetical protein D6779_01910 [Candidatus Parcubacteria bacterium]|nr:MAG: hypothetical protein D6779_01910 [Candidatus Parcubacteria bacterium]
MPFVDELDFDLAWERVIKDMGDDPYPDLLHYKDVQSNWDAFRDELLESLKGDAGKYRPEAYSAIEIPKKGFTLRPAGAMHIKDRLLYQAIIDFLAPYYAPEEPVFSYRLAGKRSSWMFKPGVEQWKSFQTKVEELCHQYKWVVETDLTAYFEHIDHKYLARRIDDIFPDIARPTMRVLKQYLMKLLSGWSNGKPYGIPQVNNPSSFLGNIYLDEFDKWMVRNNYVYLRYVDDMRVFANTEAEARRKLAEMISSLRRLGLYVSSAKTRIVKSEQVLGELDDHKDTLNAIDAAFKTKRRSAIEAIIPILNDFFFSTISDENGFRDRHFRFCIYRYRKLKAFGLGGDIHQPIVETVLSKLPELPNATDIFALYLSLFPGVPDISSVILEFLNSDYNTYAWQAAHLLEVLIRTVNPDDRQTANKCTELARNIRQSQNAHPAARAKATILLGKLGDWADRRSIRDSYYGESNLEVRRAILVAVQEMNTDERKFFYKNVQNGNSDIARAVSYLKQLNVPKYHYFNPPDPEDFADEDYLHLEEDIDYYDIWY